MITSSGTSSSKRVLVASKSDRLSNVTTVRSMRLRALLVMLVRVPSGTRQERTLLRLTLIDAQKTSRSGLGDGLHRAEPTAGQTANEVVRLLDESVDEYVQPQRAGRSRQEDLHDRHCVLSHVTPVSD